MGACVGIAYKHYNSVKSKHSEDFLTIKLSLRQIQQFNFFFWNTMENHPKISIRLGKKFKILKFL